MPDPTRPDHTVAPPGAAGQSGSGDRRKAGFFFSKGIEMKQWILAGALALGLGAGTATAQEEGGMTVEQFVQQLHFQQGQIKIPDAGATLNVGNGFRYLGAEDAQSVLEDFWANPPDDSVLGMLVPEDAPLGSDHSWAVVLTYSDDGYVSDEDAREIDYADVLKGMQSDTESVNDERKDAGYPAMHLRGWAQPPSYDAAGKRLHWAKELQVDGSDGNTLNYDIRVLGREGYLSLNAVAAMSDLARVKTGMGQVLPMAQFDAGHRYADYTSGDKTAAYGLAALVAGGVAAKTGLFAKLFAVLLAAKKLVVAGLVVVGAFLKKIFGGGKKEGTVS
jgi:uncharacterized membrane-anchored protein